MPQSELRQMPPFSEVCRNLTLLYGFLMASQCASRSCLLLYVFDL